MLDTNVVSTAFRSRFGASNALLDLLVDRRFVALVTTPLFLQYEDVLKRPEQRLASGLSLNDVDDLLRELAALLEPVEVHYRWRPQLSDPGDELVLEAAVNGRAKLLVTYDKGFAAAALRFGVAVAEPKDVLHKLGKRA